MTRQRGAASRFTACNAALQPKPLPRPPESVRPDRPEVISRPGQNQLIELDRGVLMDCLAGAHNQARNLTTGLVTFASLAKLACHRHTVSESVTVLQGTLIIEVQGRQYPLGLLDTVVIPPGLAHAASNPSADSEALLHVALAAATPARELVASSFVPVVMPPESAGVAGAERIIRHRTAERFAAGPGTCFIDYFNRQLMPDIEMSGGYGRFQPGGRLPAHFHDFDESICIIEGVATCVVEGRHYELSNCSAALQPHGRVHYFSNNRDHAMAMIWVYAGPAPERIVVEESCATEEGDPWKIRRSTPML